jgi:endonuclease IV
MPAITGEEKPNNSTRRRIETLMISSFSRAPLISETPEPAHYSDYSL